MTLIAIIGIALSVVFTRSASFSFGQFRITAADVTGSPVHFTFALAVKTMQQALSGGAGTIQVGDIAVTISI